MADCGSRRRVKKTGKKVRSPANSGWRSPVLARDCYKDMCSLESMDELMSKLPDRW